MTFKASFLYASRMLFPPKKSNSQASISRHSLLGAAICIGISLIPLVVVLVLSDGMIQGITERMIGLSSQDISVMLSPKSSPSADKESFLKFAERLNAIDGVDKVWAEVDGTVLAAGKSFGSGAAVRAVPQEIFSENHSFSSLLRVIEGKTVFSEERSAILGEKIASLLDVHVGDKVRLISVNTTSGGRMVPKASQFTVEGIVSSGYQELDALWIFIPLETAWKIIPQSSAQYVLGLTTPVTFEAQLARVKNNVQLDILGYFGNEVVKGASVYTWKEIHAAEYENFASTQILLLLIMILIVLVAAVNISSALLMAVMERKREIAILKSMGASPGGISFAFLLTGAACAGGGILFGLPTGILCAVNINQILQFIEKTINVFAKSVYLISNSKSKIAFSAIHLLDPAYYLQDIPISLPFKELFLIVWGTLLLSLAVSVIPSVKAGREKPLDTLRKS
mgnify:CR=1 FL=1